MKSFQAICLQFCVTLSAPFLTCHKNVAHTHTYTHRQTLTVVTLETQLGSNSPASQQTLPGCQSRSKLATRQGVTLINGVALLTPTSLSVWLPFQPPSRSALQHFTFIFEQNFFRVPISRKISFKCNKMQCRCHKSIPFDCRRRHKIEMH